MSKKRKITVSLSNGEKTREFTMRGMNVFCGDYRKGFEALLAQLSERNNYIKIDSIFNDTTEFINLIEGNSVINKYLESNRDSKILRVVVIDHFMENVNRWGYGDIVKYLQSNFPELTFIVWTQNELAAFACAIQYENDMQLHRFSSRSWCGLGVNYSWDDVKYSYEHRISFT